MTYRLSARSAVGEFKCFLCQEYKSDTFIYVSVSGIEHKTRSVKSFTNYVYCLSCVKDKREAEVRTRLQIEYDNL